MRRDIDEIIHQPIRTKIMAMLYALGEEVEFKFIRDELKLTDGNLSSHLSKLEAAGYVRIRKVFEGRKPKTYISISEKGVKAFENYVSIIGKILNIG